MTLGDEVIPVLEGRALLGVEEVRLAKRTKVGNPFAKHYGVYLRNCWGEELVVDLNHEGGVRLKSLAEFANGRGVSFEHALHGDELEASLTRLNKMCAQGEYHLVNNNCEHFAREVVTGATESLQVQFAGFLGVLCLLVATTSS